MALLAGVQTGMTQLEPALGMASIGIWLGGFLFVLNLLLHLQAGDLAAGREA